MCYSGFVSYETEKGDEPVNPIRALRLDKRMSQRELAEIIGVNQTAVSKWEIEKAYPDMESTRKLADFFNVSVDYIHGRLPDERTKKIDYSRGLRLIIDDASENARLTGLPKEFLYQLSSAALPDVYYELLNKYRRDGTFRDMVELWGKLDHIQKQNVLESMHGMLFNADNLEIEVDDDE